MSMEKEGLTAAELTPFDPSVLSFRDDAVKAKMLSIVRPMKKRSISMMDVVHARRFIKRHEEVLGKAEKESAVPREVVVSIIWIETTFGTYLGRYSVLDTLASLALLRIPEIGREIAGQSRVLAQVEADEDKTRDDDWKDVDWSKRTQEVGDRWYGELKSFLRLCSHADWDVHEVFGSWAGAIGYGQFLPSVALDYMLERPVDLWNWEDMIPLIARELAKIGWSSTETGASKEEVLSRYNAPRAYVEAVLEMRARLAGVSN